MIRPTAPVATTPPSCLRAIPRSPARGNRWWIILALGVLAFPWSARAQLFTYNFNDVAIGSASSAGGTASNLLFSSFTASGLTPGTTNAGSRFSMVGWDTGATNGSDTFTGSVNLAKYFTFTITPDAGYALNLDQIIFTLQRSGTGIRQYEVRSSLDNYGANLSASISPANANLSVVPTDIFQVSDATTSAQDGSTVTLGNAFDALTAPVTFRFYGFNAEAATGTFSLDNVTSLGTVAFLAARNLTWNPSAGQMSWNGVATNWLLNGATPTNFQSLDNVNFTDAGLASGSVVTVDNAGVSASLVNVSNTSGNYTLQQGTVTASGALTKTGAGTLTLSSVVNAGAYLINGGNVTTTADERLSDTAPVTVAAGAKLDFAGHDETIGALNVLGGTVSTGAGLLTFSGPSSAGGSATMSVISGMLTPAVASTIVVSDAAVNDPAVDLLLSATLIDGVSIGRLSFSGTGTTELRADNSGFSGGLTLVSGALILDQATSLGLGGTSGPLFFWNGGTLRAGNPLTAVDAVTNAISLGGDVAVSGTNDLELSGNFVFFAGNANIKTLTVNNPNLILSGVISGASTAPAARFVKAGPGKLTLTNSNTIANQIGINQGVIDALNDSAFGTANVSFTPSSPNTATINFKTATPFIGSLSSSGTGVSKVVLGDAAAGPTTALSIGTGNITASYAGSIENAPGQVGSVIKVGTGQQTLAGTGTYTGDTSVTAGTLLISGTLTGTTNVLVDTGTLGGNGTINLPTTGQVTLANGAALAPGNGPGSTGALKVNGTVIAGSPGTIDFTAGTSFSVELGSTAAGGTLANPGLVDQIMLAGDLRLNGATFSGSLLNNFYTQVNDLFFLVINDGSDPIDGLFAGLAQNSILTLIGLNRSADFRISYTGDSVTNAFTAVGGNDLVLQTIAFVPEPGALSSLVLGAAGLLGFRRVRRRG